MLCTAPPAEPPTPKPPTIKPGAVTLTPPENFRSAPLSTSTPEVPVPAVLRASLVASTRLPETTVVAPV